MVEPCIRERLRLDYTGNGTSTNRFAGQGEECPIIRGETTAKANKLKSEEHPAQATASEIQKAPIVERVRAILKNPEGPDMPNLEAEINTLIFDLYDLTAEEIAMVEESAGRG